MEKSGTCDVKLIEMWYEIDVKAVSMWSFSIHKQDEFFSKDYVSCVYESRIEMPEIQTLKAAQTVTTNLTVTKNVFI